MLFFIASFLVSFGAKSIIKSHLEQIVPFPVEFKSVKLTLPLTIELDDFNIKGLCSVKKVVLYPDILKLIRGYIYFENVRLNSITVEIERSGKKIFNVNTSSVSSISEDKPLDVKDALTNEGRFVKSSVKKKPIRKPRPVVLKSVILEDVKLKLIDNTIKPQSLTIEVENIHVDINQLLFPPLVVEFIVSAEVLGRPNKNVGLLNMHGWVNMNSKDMQARFKLSNLDGVYFESYFKRFLPAKLLSAVMNISIDMDAKNNILKGKGRVQVKDFELEDSQDLKEKGIGGPLSNIVLMGLTSPEKKIEVGFSLANTKLDRPVFRLRSINADIMKPTIESFIENPEATVEKLKSIVGQIESIKDIFKSK